MAKTESMRGSERIMAAWKARALTEESVREIAAALGESKGSVEGVAFAGGDKPTGVTVAMRYVDDSLPWCGNDIQFWLSWLRKHGGVPKRPRIIINGKPWPDFLELELDFGIVPEIEQELDLGGFAGNVGG